MRASTLVTVSFSMLALAAVGCQQTQARPIVRGSLGTGPTTAHCPDGMAHVTADGIDVCVDEYEAAVDGWHFSEPLDAADGGVHPARPAKGERPQVDVSEVDAETACDQAGKRLCTEAEWTTACRGASHFLYPYGNTYEPGACNDARPSPVGRAGATKLDDPRLGEAPNGSAPGGSFPKCVSPYGIFDMHGNVHEWVSTPSKPDDPRFGEFLGGFFADAKENGRGCTYKTTAHLKTYRDYSTGFRCCRDPL